MGRDLGQPLHDIVEVGPRLTVGPSLAMEDLPRLVMHGFRGVVSLCTDEDDVPQRPREEGLRVRCMGLGWAHVPVDPRRPLPEDFEAFERAVDAMPGAVWVHCRTGRRAGTFALLYQGLRDGLSAQEILEKGRALGLPVDDAVSRQFVQDYVGARAMPV